MIGVLILTITALLLGVIIVLVDSSVKESLKDKIIKCLPRYNCGACGFGSCEGMATELSKKNKVYDKCRILKEDQKREIDKLID